MHTSIKDWTQDSWKHTKVLVTKRLQDFIIEEEKV
jgi:hypothetical protein